MLCFSFSNSLFLGVGLLVAHPNLQPGGRYFSYFTLCLYCWYEKKLRNQLNGTERFVNVFTRTCYLSQPWARWIHSTPSHPTSFKFALILLYHLCLGLLKGRFLSNIPIKFCINISSAPHVPHIPPMSFILIWCVMVFYD